MRGGAAYSVAERTSRVALRSGVTVSLSDLELFSLFQCPFFTFKQS